MQKNNYFKFSMTMSVCDEDLNGQMLLEMSMKLQRFILCSYIYYNIQIKISAKINDVNIGHEILALSIFLQIA